MLKKYEPRLAYSACHIFNILICRCLYTLVTGVGEYVRIQCKCWRQRRICMSAVGGVTCTHVSGQTDRQRSIHRIQYVSQLLGGRCRHVLYKNAFHKQLRNAFYSCLYCRQSADPSGRVVLGVSLQPFPCLDCGFESRLGHGCQSVVSVVCCQEEDSASGWSLVQRSPTNCGVSLSVIMKPR
jgi:hypothetical protein